MIQCCQPRRYRCGDPASVSATTTLTSVRRRTAMICRTTLALGATAFVSLASSAAMAQNAPPSYEGDPDVYKVIFEDQNFRVIDSIRKKGVHDKLHSHPVPSIVYHLTDCTSLSYGPDGKPTGSPSNRKAGTAQTGSITPAHSVENVGPEDCHQIFVERK